MERPFQKKETALIKAYRWNYMAFTGNSNASIYIDEIVGFKMQKR